MYKLYRLIWQRFVASQMEAAVYDTLQVEVTGKTSGHEYLLRASGSAVKFAGFLVVYEEAKNEDVKVEEEENVKIPGAVAEGQKQELIRLIPEQHFTQPPPRYSEASLVQALEEDGIGLRVELDAGEAVMDLTRREADLALRTVRPTRGDLIVTRLATVAWIPVAAPRLARRLGTLRAFGDAPWVGWGERLATVPPARWLETHVGADPVVRSDHSWCSSRRSRRAPASR